MSKYKNIEDAFNGTQLASDMISLMNTRIT